MPLPRTPVVDNVDDVTADHVNTLYDIAEKSAALAYFVNTETLAGTKTLVDADAGMQYLDPGGAARDVVLPAEAVGNHIFWITNTADAAETLTIKNDAAGVIGTVAINECKTFISNGVAWRALTNTATGSMVKIQEVILSSPSNYALFAAIPGTYKSLKIIYNARGSNAAAEIGVYTRLNGVSSTDYDTQITYASNTTTTSVGDVGATAMLIGYVPAATSSSDLSGQGEVLFADYAATVFNKTLSYSNGLKVGSASGNLRTLRGDGFYRRSVAITQILVYCGGGGNFEIGSTFSLYGIP